MVSRTDAPAKWELRSFIRCLQVQGNRTAEIYKRMSRVYRERFMSDDVAREWCKKFKDGRTDVIDKRGMDENLAQQMILSNEFPSASGAIKMGRL
ncbi:hypothetical protein AVEN_203163-1 [Araneus ventricosus]|uniref:Mos1 transposase HTH domain-containing protein n=1 Tax=Araneus ventricosus TaxID=182803 RepID=A0A4Y2CIM1_ARAVE|nr:hypothetical protein AVEN_203163-1 [Araneus ventricosus]